MAKFGELIPGLHDFVDDIPVPTKEEGGMVPQEPEDLDDKEVTPGNVDITIDIGERQDTIEQMQILTRSMYRHVQDMDCMIKNNRDGIYSNEDFSMGMTELIVGVFNIIGHVTNLFTTTLFHGWRDFKRSELTEYSDSNRLTMTRIYTMKYQEATYLKIPTPQGMKGTYPAALKALDTYLVELDMLKRCKRMLATIENIEKDLIKGNPNFLSQVRDAQKQFTDKRLQDLFKNTGKFFTGSRDEGGQFEKHFNSIAEFEETVKRCMDMDSHLRGVASVFDYLKDIEKVVGRIADSQKARELNRQQSEDISKVVRTLAETFESYATVINDLSRMNHNLTYVVMELRKRVER